MTKTDLPRLVRVLELLGATFNEKISDLRSEGYLMGLSDLSIEDVERGARRALKESKFFPRPAELRDLAVGSAIDRAELGWLELLAEVRRIGAWGRPELSLTVSHAAIEIWGSWRQLCETLPGEGPELLGWAKKFKSAYAAMTSPSRLTIASAVHPNLLPQPCGDDDVPL